MIKNKILKSVFIVLQTLAITGVTVCSITNVACKISAEGIKLLHGDYESPVLVDFVVEDARKVSMYFSEEVKLSNCSVSLVGEESDENYFRGYGISEGEFVDEKYKVSVTLDSNTILGKDYEFYGVVTDENGNSLSFEVPFKGFNSRIPVLVMTEIQSASVGSQTSKEKTAGIYRNEYVEFLCLQAGNLSGLELISGYDGEAKKYVFPAIEVARNEIIVVHLRNRGNGCISETGSNLSEAYSSYTSSNVRDLWADEESTVLGNKTDVIVLKNQADGSVLDAAFYRDSSVESWSKDMEMYAIQASAAGIYESYEPDFASISDGLTDTKTLHRNDLNRIIYSQFLEGKSYYSIKANEDSWIIGAATPGEL